MQDAEQAMDTETAATEPGSTLQPGSLSVGDSADGATGEVPPQNVLASFLLVAGLALAIFILLRRIYRRPRSASPEAGMTSRERIDAVREKAESARVTATAGRDGLDRCMSDAEELTRRLAATLDNKAARIERLIDDAENAIRRLEETTQHFGAAEPRASVGSGDGPRLSGRQRLDPSLLDRARLDQLTRERNGGEIEAAPAETSRPETAGARGSEVDVTRRVYELADEGNDAVQIARELDQPVGQVELMLNLRRQTG